MTEPIGEPVGRHLDRIEAAAQLMDELPSCDHCEAQARIVAWLEGGELPRAIDVAHQPGCLGDPGLDQAAVEVTEADLARLVQHFNGGCG